MSNNDRGIVRVKQISLKEKVIAIVMLVTLCAALTVPVSQAARYRELEVQRRLIASQVALVDEQTRLLEAQLAEAQLPEVTAKRSVLKGLSLEKIVFDQAKIVVIGE